METNGNLSAYPIDQSINSHQIKDSRMGLTKREYFAGLALQGLLSAGNMKSTLNFIQVSEIAVEFADALLLTLSKEPND